MDPMTHNEALIAAIHKRIGALRDRLGDDWDRFAAELGELLTAVLLAPTDDEASLFVDEIIGLGLASPAPDIFQAILDEVNRDGNRKGPRQPSLPATRERLNETAAFLADRLWPPKMAMDDMATAFPDEVPPVTCAEDASPPRFFNAGFFPSDSDDSVPVDQPLSLDRAWRLGVNIGAPWGPGQLDDGSFDEILAGAFSAHETLDLVVAVRSRSVKVEPQIQTLTVARTGDSARVFFDLTFGRAARHALNIDLFFMGHLIKSRRLVVEVVRKAGMVPPAGAKPQDSVVLFSRAEALTPEVLTPLVKHPRRLTITVQHEDRATRLCFYDLTRGLIGEQPLPVSDGSLTTLLNRTRSVLQTVVGSYKNRVGGDMDELRLNLWQLASAGFELYRVLLKGIYDPDAAGPGGKPIVLDLEAGQTIQVAPLSHLAGVPWELLYDRKIERYRKEQPDRVALCPDFMNHAPDECPNEQDSNIVCPSGFWGFRYVIEQLPNRVPPGHASTAQLPLQVRNMLPLRLAALVFGFKELEDHLKALSGLTDRLDLARVDTLELVESTLTQDDHLPDILYFYAHGGFDKDAPTLTLGPANSRFELTVDDLEAWTIDLSPRQPLVIMNACESASYRPDRVESLLEALVSKGASGIIGTQVQVQPALAEAFILPFFRAFLADATVGEALFRTRQRLLTRQELISGEWVHRPDPRGLAYSLFAAAEIALAMPILQTAQQVAVPPAPLEP